MYSKIVSSLKYLFPLKLSRSAKFYSPFGIFIILLLIKTRAAASREQLEEARKRRKRASFQTR